MDKPEPFSDWQEALQGLAKDHLNKRGSVRPAGTYLIPGHGYLTPKEIAGQFNFPTETIEHRINQGKTGAALIEPFKKKEKPDPLDAQIEIPGFEPMSIRAAAKQFNLRETLIFYRYQKGIRGSDLTKPERIRRGKPLISDIGTS
jgi:hypothetical protein